MHLTSLVIENFGAFRRATLEPIGGLAVLVGGHGVGKSTVLRVFELMKRALRGGATEAFESVGSFAALRHRGTTDPVRFVFNFSTGLRYEVAFVSAGGEVSAAHEELCLDGLELFEFSAGSGQALVNEYAAPDPDAAPDYEGFAAAQPSALGLSLVGGLAKNTTAVRVRAFFDSVRHFRPDPASIRAHISSPEQVKSLSDNAANLGAVLRDLETSHPAAMKQLVSFVTSYVPGLGGVEAREEIEHRVKLWLRDVGGEPFPAALASDGTLRLLSYATLLARSPASGLLCLDEPELELHHTVFAELVEGLRAMGATGPQVLVVTHAPDLLNAVQIDEAFVVQKRGGASTVTAAAANENVVSLVAAGDVLGALWRQNILDTTPQ